VRRREFITLIGGAAAWPLVAQAQQAERMRRVGILTTHREGDAEVGSWLVAFRQRLEVLGWKASTNLELESRFAGGDADRLRAHALELVGLRSDVILANGTPVVAALQQVTKTIPIVFVNAQNPVGSGFVASLSRPSGNITGFISFEPDMGGKWLETLSEVAPDVKRVAALYNPQTHTGQYWASIESAARTMSLILVRMPFLDVSEIDQVLSTFASEPHGGVLVLADISTGLHREVIVNRAARYRLPAVYPYRAFISSGGLAYYGVDQTDLVRQSAHYVDRILKGEKAAELPVQGSVKYELVINLKAAKSLGLDVPPTLLARADEVIE
jgi:putative ABC transport system substrate-binding protein